MTVTNAQELTAPPRAAPARKLAGPREVTALWVGVILLGHGVYGILLARSPALATLHAIVTFGVALWLALTSSMRRVAMVCAYMAGSEILWRLGKAALPWEFVKYAIVVTMVIMLARVRRLRWDWAAVTYFALLMPSTFLSFSERNFEFARQQVSFNLSGPLLLAVSTWFFSQMSPTRADVQRLFLAITAPIVSLGMIAMTQTASLSDISFSDASNFQTSAGYGPNQVSTALGLGVLLCLLLAFLVERRALERIIYCAVAVFLGVLSALTFSRGGLFGAVGALVIAGPFLLQGARSKVALAVGALALVVMVEAVVLPKLDSFTSGALTERFEDTDPTGRDVLIMTQLETFMEHPIFGVGPASFVEFGDIRASVHTEFSRLPAQHGIFGIGALLLMIFLATRDTLRQRSAAARAMAVGLLAWSALTMTHAAMRLAIVPFAFGLAAALLLRPDPRGAPAGQGEEGR